MYSGPRYRQLGTKMATKRSQNGANLAPKWSNMEPKWAKISKRVGSKKQRHKKRGGVPQLRFILPEKVANMASSWGPKSMKNRKKNRSKNRLFFWCLLGSIFERILVDFGRQNGAKLAPKSIKNRCQLRNAIFWKIVLWLQPGLDFCDSGSRSWEQKSIKNRLKNGVQDGWHLGIDFSWILVDFGRQVGRQTGAKIDPKRHRKTMRKTTETRLPKKSQQESQPTRETSGFGSWEGVGGGINPSPREEGKGMTPVQHPKPPQPRGLVGFFKFLIKIYIFVLNHYFWPHLSI